MKPYPPLDLGPRRMPANRRRPQPLLGRPVDQSDALTALALAIAAGAIAIILAVIA